MTLIFGIQMDLRMKHLRQKRNLSRRKKIERQTKDENNLPKFYNYQYYLDKDIKSLNKNEAVEEICIDYFVKKMNYIKNNKELFVAYPIWMYYVVKGQYQELIKEEIKYPFIRSDYRK